MARPKKIVGPINLEILLRIALPKKRYEDRMKIFRRWAIADLTKLLQKMPSESEIETQLERWYKKQFFHAIEIDNIADCLKTFIPAYTARNRKEKASRAAIARWAKKEKKSL